MRPQELIEKLAASGTGKEKLGALSDVLATFQEVTAEVVDRVVAKSRLIPPGTVAKIRQILDGTFSETAGAFPGAPELLERLRNECGEMLDTFETKLDGALANIESQTSGALEAAKAEMQRQVVQAIADSRAELSRLVSEAVDKFKAELKAESSKAKTDKKGET